MVKLIPRYKNSQSPTLAAPQPIRVHNGEYMRAARSENADKLEPVFTQSLIKQGENRYDVPEELVPGHLMHLAATVFEEYSGIRVSDEEAKKGFWASIKRLAKRQVRRFRNQDKVLVKALDAVPAHERVRLTLGLAIHAAQRFKKDDAVDFMLSLSEILADRSEGYRSAYSTYWKFAEKMEEMSGESRELPGTFDDKERRSGIYAITSVRGRLGALCFAQAEEEMHCTVAIAEHLSEISAAVEDMGRRNCHMLFDKPWCLFDAEYYQSI